MAPSLISVADADRILAGCTWQPRVQTMPLATAYHYTLAEDLITDTDLPSFDRVTMDGIAVKFDDLQPNKPLTIVGIQAAGAPPQSLNEPNTCLEIMTGAMLPINADTIIPYEDITINGTQVVINIIPPNKGKNIHCKGIDSKQGTLVASKGTLIDSNIIGVAASIGKHILQVYSPPKVAILSTGNELVSIDTVPQVPQLRRSNDITLQSIVQSLHCACTLVHVQDDPETIKHQLSMLLKEHDFIICTGAVSKGKYDYLPSALEAVGVEPLFHKIKQRPGKPFWLGRHNDHQYVFAFPGNPVSAFLCCMRYFMPWLQRQLGIKTATPPIWAKLTQDIQFAPTLTYFMQVQVSVHEDATIQATPVQGNGSGDYINLLQANAFMELPDDKSTFLKGEVYRIWPYKQII